MPDYNLGKIYKIVDNTNGNIYVGSTCEPTLARRLAKHLGNYKEYLNKTHNFITSFNIFKNENYDIVLIESFPCKSKDELHARERHYIEILNCVNIVVPTRSHKEYQQDNKEKIKIRMKKYREDNCEKIKEQKREYDAAYRLEHASKIKDYNKTIYEIKGKEVFSCICGGKYKYQHKATHIKTKKHQAYINSQTEV